MLRGEVTSIFAHLLLYETSFEIADRALSSLLNQELDDHLKLDILVGDNSVSEEVLSRLKEKYQDHKPGKAIQFFHFNINIGFCGGHNFAARLMLDKRADYFVTLNPDLYLPKECFLNLFKKLQELSSIKESAPFILTPLLLQADLQQEPIIPEVIDSAGIKLTKELRHFDRGRGEAREQYLNEEEVFGGSGAFLVFNRQALCELELASSENHQLYKIYPQLKADYNKRYQLFDEAFFAYREDAELAFRAQALGISCYYSPQVFAYHTRQVTADKRGEVAPKLNAFSVRNRFLIQFNHFSSLELLFLPIALLRNALVIVAVLIKEQSSLPALKEALLLYRRGRARYRALNKKRRFKGRDILDFF
jgi:GT2 family glycosyltransferase